MYNFIFTRPVDGDIALHSSKTNLFNAYDIDNSSPVGLSRTVTVSEKVTNEFTWNFPESLKQFEKVIGSVAVPFLADAPIVADFKFTQSADQNFQNSIDKLFSMSYVVNVPERSNVRVSASYEHIKGISMDYTASSEITDSSTNATGEMIRRHLNYLAFDGTIVVIKENSVIAQIKGTMVASVGVNGQLFVDGQTVALQTVPDK